MKILTVPFEELTPEERGYAVYMYGARKDVEDVPDEKNPYPVGTPEHEEWIRGAELAVQAVQDDP